MHHVMAWWCLMALGTVQGSRWWMKKFRIGPSGRNVALCTVIAEQSKVSIVILMAGYAIQDLFLWCELGMTRLCSIMFDPVSKLLSGQVVFTIGGWIALELSYAYS